jgi:hypothetical protein
MNNKKCLAALLLLLPAISFAQFTKHLEVSINPGYSTFTINNEKGMSLSGEFLYHFNRWVNPSVRITSANGLKSIEKGMGAYHPFLNTLSFNLNLDVLKPGSKHVIQLGAGPGIHFENHNYILGTYYVEELNRNVNEVISEGRLCFGLNYVARYRYKLRNNFQLGLEWSNTGFYTKGFLNQSSLSLNITSLIN